MLFIEHILSKCVNLETLYSYSRIGKILKNMAKFERLKELDIRTNDYVSFNSYIINKFSRMQCNLEKMSILLWNSRFLSDGQGTDILNHLNELLQNQLYKHMRN